MANAIGRPHPALGTYVGEYVGYHHVLDPQAVHHGLPGPTATVVIAFDEPLHVGWLGESGSFGRRWTTASGLHIRPALVVTHGLQHGIQVDLTPEGVRALLGIPIGDLGALLVDHDDIPLGVDSATLDALATTESWPDRFAVLERHLMRLVERDTPPPPRPEVTEAWRLLRRSRGRLAIAEVARRVGWSRRHLAARFAREYGLGPKQAARLIRFDHARRLARAGRSLADTAAVAGYADQSHLTRDWRALAGLTPGETLGEPFRIVQDTGAR